MTPVLKAMLIWELADAYLHNPKATELTCTCPHPKENNQKEEAVEMSDLLLNTIEFDFTINLIIVISIK